MKRKAPDPKKKKDADLRKRAESMLAKQKERLRELSSADLKKLVHELGTHQIELEMQNEELRRAQAELDSSRRKYADLYDFSPVGYFTFDRNGLIREVNLIGAGMLGWEKRSLIAKPIQNFIEPEGREAFHGHLAKVFRTQTRQTCELTLRRKNGVLFSAQLQSIDADSGEGTIDSCRTAVSDVSELKQAAEALAAANVANEKIMRLLESVPDGMAIVNDRHEIVMVNDQFQHMTGYTRDELRGQVVEKLVPTEVASPHVEWRNEYIKGPKARPMGAKSNLFCRRKDGTSFPVEISLSPLETNEGAMVIAVVRDVTERNRAESSHRLAAAVFANTTEGIVITDAEGVIQSVNKAFEQVTGFREAEVIGKTTNILKSGLQNAEFYDWLWKILRETGTWRGNFWNRRKNGELYPQETSVNAIKNERGEIVQYCAIFRDVTRQHKLEEALRMLSATDGLTGLANRRAFDETLEREWRRAQRSGYPLAMIIGDIDHFKKFNDAYGHPAGDECLKKVGTSFKNAVRRAGDLAARYGGEEFVLLLPMTKSTEAAQIAEDMRKSVEALKILHPTGDTEGVVTLSMGVAAVVPHQDMAPDALIVRADTALYRAKQEGRNCVKLDSESSLF